MFNSTLKKEAIRIQEEMLQRYNVSYDNMKKSCECLYSASEKAVDLLKVIRDAVNSITNCPEDLKITLGKIETEIAEFEAKENSAIKAYNNPKRIHSNIANKITVGFGAASLAGNSIATSMAEGMPTIGKTYAGVVMQEMPFATSSFTLAGVIGMGISAVLTGKSLISLSSENKKIANSVVQEAKEIESARKAMDEVSEKIMAIKVKMEFLYEDMYKQRNKIMGFMNLDYILFSQEDKCLLGGLIKNALSLSKLLNETIQ